MKPIAILRFADADGPAYFADFLNEAGRPFIEVRIDQEQAVPGSASEFAGLGLMGGPMSVNDPLPWIPQALSLIRDAVAKDIPLIGHCLGGQLISKALGGSVSRNPNGKEIGWHPLQILDPVLAEEWLGSAGGFDAFHWHGETFTLPEGARWLARSERCDHQAFVLGPHIGMQFHIEMNESTIADWCSGGEKEIVSARKKPDNHPAVMAADVIQAITPVALPRMRAAARHLYQRWLRHVRT
jgi:GMP synthase-like glutamine amidotransferase